MWCTRKDESSFWSSLLFQHGLGRASQLCVHFLASRASGANKFILASSDPSFTHSFSQHAMCQTPSSTQFHDQAILVVEATLLQDLKGRERGKKTPTPPFNRESRERTGSNSLWVFVVFCGSTHQKPVTDFIPYGHSDFRIFIQSTFICISLNYHWWSR